MKQTSSTPAEQLRLARAALEESERRWHFALESAETGVWDADLVSDTVYYSPMWKRMRGYEPEEEIDSAADAWLMRVHPDDRAHMRDVVRRQNVGAIRHSAVEYRERHKAGHYIWISSVGGPVQWTKDGTPTRVVGTDTDVTKRKIVEQKNRELSRRLALAVDISKIGVYESNIETGELLWDDRTYEIYGIERVEQVLHESTWSQALHPDDAAGALAAMARAAKEKGAYDAQYRIIRPDGTIRTLVSRGVYVEDEHAGRRIIGADRDISAEVEMTQSLVSAKELAEARNAELDAARARMEQLSLHDALTGLSNRRYLDELLEHKFSELEVAGGLALLHIDLDGFKQINDTLGHHIGDELLVRIAGRLRDGTDPQQVVSRLGGDEFVICTSGANDAEAALAAADSIRKRVVEPLELGGHTVLVGCSIGVAIAPAHGTTAHDLMIAADLALYRAKAAGGNATRMFVPEYRIAMQQRQSMESELQRAFENQEFELHYQPQLDLQSREVIGAEALLRWRHPKRGLLAPAAFLPALEGHRLAEAVGSWILRQAGHDAARMQAAGRHICMGVNLFSAQFRSGSLEEVVTDVLLETGLAPNLMELEVTENIVLENDAAIPEALLRLRRLGIRIALDDYGTGYASLGTLKHFPLTRLKIDRSFIANLEDDAGDRAVVQAVLQLGDGFGLEVIAEGIETEGQASALSHLGCKLGQGYLFGRPTEIADFWAFIDPARIATSG